MVHDLRHTAARNLQSLCPGTSCNGDHRAIKPIANIAATVARMKDLSEGLEKLQMHVESQSTEKVLVHRLISDGTGQ